MVLRHRIEFEDNAARHQVSDSGATKLPNEEGDIFSSACSALLTLWFGLISLNEGKIFTVKTNFLFKKFFFREKYDL